MRGTGAVMDECFPRAAGDEEIVEAGREKLGKDDSAAVTRAEEVVLLHSVRLSEVVQHTDEDERLAPRRCTRRRSVCAMTQ
jgi:hypothetical protein